MYYRRSQYLGTILADIGKPDPTDQEKFYSFVKLLFQKKVILIFTSSRFKTFLNAVTTSKH